LWRTPPAKAKSRTGAAHGYTRAVRIKDVAVAKASGRGPADERLAEAALRRELYFFTLYRSLEAALIVFLAFSPLAGYFSSLRHPALAKVTAVVYLLVALLLLLTGRDTRYGFQRQAGFGLACDIVAALLAIHAIAGVQTGISLLLMVNVGAGAVLLPLRWGLGFAATAAVLIVAEYVFAQSDAGSGRNLPEVMMFGATYLAAGGLCHLLGRQMRESHALAAKRGAEVANLSQLNELIIRRMRTGVLVVDGADTIQLINEAAYHLVGHPSPAENQLSSVSEELARRLHQWRLENQSDARPVELFPDTPPVIPRFARLTVTDDLFLIFLDDTSLVSRRAEELTLSTLGRLSASIAHEIRNPLAAISYSAQLLEESPDLPDTDRRLVEIIVSHCNRMNGIVENVLNLSRRERSRPESVDLAQWVFQFVDDFKATRYLDQDEVKGVAQSRHLHAMVDPQQLHQVVTNLVQNALNYGKLPGEPARITLTARQLAEGSPPLVEVIDRGPGIPPRVADSIFEPFFTTHEHGTGLGLYLARQLCEANQATLDYVPVAGGGSCFRITLTRAQRLETAASVTERSGRPVV
jgi:two-component system sensor histidine kinase PilS (NtrC family)